MTEYQTPADMLDADEEDFDGESEYDADCGLSARALRELRSYWTDEDCAVIEDSNLRLLGHSDRNVQIPPPSSLPASASMQPDRQVLWLLLFCLQQGRDIAGYPLSWWSGQLDHIDPVDRRYTLGNIQLLEGSLNGFKGKLTQIEFAEKLLTFGVISENQTEEIVRQHKHRLADPIGFLNWQLNEARSVLADSDSESGGSSYTTAGR